MSIYANERFTYEEVFLEVILNGQLTSKVYIFLKNETDDFFINENDLHDLKIIAPSESLTYLDMRYYPLSALESVKYRLDTKKLLLYLDVPAQHFSKSEFMADAREFVIPTEADLGGFFNYDLFAQTDNNEQSLSGLLLPGLFYKNGNITSGFLTQMIDSKKNTVRLNTTIEIDDPFNMRSLFIGDSFSTPAMWGNSVDFGGIQWGTNFNTQPAFITFPLPSISGEAVVPSTVELYSENVLIDQESVPAGPFTINEIPALTGEGTLTMVTTDILGRQETITVPYYEANTLLKPGLHDYTIDVGFIRENYGLASNDYGNLMVMMTDEFGVTDRFTSEWHIEAQSSQQAAGLGGLYKLDDFGVFNFAGAASISELGNGGLGMFGFQREVWGGIDYSFNLTGTTSDFSQVGLGEDQLSPAFIGQYFVGIPLPLSQSITVGYTQVNNRDQENFGLVTAAYYEEIFADIFLSVIGQTTVSGPRNNGIFLTLTKGFGALTTANVGFSLQEDYHQGTAQLNQSLPVGPGWGYDLYAAPGENSNYLATLSAQNDIGTYSVGVAQQNSPYGDNTGYQAQVSGALVMIDDTPYLSRTLYNGFGVVHVPGQENITVYNFNQEIGVTDDEGKVFIPNLLPYQNNLITIGTDDLPIGVEIESAAITAIPYFNSGLLIEFPIQSTNGAVAHIYTDFGKPVRPGSLVEELDGENAFIIADRGEVYLTDLHVGKNEFIVKYNNNECIFALDYKKTHDPLPDLGTFVCKGAGHAY